MSRVNVGRYTVDLHMLASDMANEGRVKDRDLLLAVATRLVKLENLAQEVAQAAEKIEGLDP